MRLIRKQFTGSPCQPTQTAQQEMIAARDGADSAQCHAQSCFLDSSYHFPGQARPAHLPGQWRRRRAEARRRAAANPTRPRSGSPGAASPVSRGVAGLRARAPREQLGLQRGRRRRRSGAGARSRKPYMAGVRRPWRRRPCRPRRRWAAGALAARPGRPPARAAAAARR